MMGRTERWRAAVTGLVLALVVADGAVLVAGTAGRDDAAAHVERSLRLRDALSATLVDLQALETGSRGFVITGDEAFLEPYHAARASTPLRLDDVDQLSVGEAALQAHVAELRELATVQLAAREDIVEARRGLGTEAAARLVAEGPARRAMEASRRLVEGMRSDARRDLAESEARAAAFARLVRRSGLSLLALTGVLVVALFLLFRRELRRRADAERRLGVANDALEARVTGRTVELARQQEILQATAEGLPLAAALEMLVRYVEDRAPATLGSVLLLGDDGAHVRHGAAPSLPSAFVQAIEGAPIGPSAGSCGTAMYRRASVIVEDIATDELWSDYRVLALEHGLRACWSTPILDTRGAVLGSLALYARAPGRPGPRGRGRRGALKAEDVARTRAASRR